MGLDSLVTDEESNNDEQEELGEDWMVIPVDIEVIAQKQTEITVRADEAEEFKQQVQEELDIFEGWVAGRLYKHPDVMTVKSTDPEKLKEQHFDNE